MTALLPAFLASAAVIGAGMLLPWGLSVWLRDASLADVAWGSAFLRVCLASMAVTGPPTPRGALLGVAVAAWSARPALHIGLRNRGNGEDPRYRALRERRGPGSWWQSLQVVSATQGLLVLLISLPLQGVLDPGGAGHPELPPAAGFGGGAVGAGHRGPAAGLRRLYSPDSVVLSVVTQAVTGGCGGGAAVAN